MYVDLATMRPDNFAHYIESEPEALVDLVTLPLAGASAKRIKDLIQSRSLDGWPAVHDLQANIRLLAG